MLSDSYLKTIARSVGCPDLWLDDCVQEQRIGLFLAPNVPMRTIAKRRAVDFMRWLHGRRGTRLTFCNIDGLPLHDDGMEAVDRVLNYRAVLERLTPAQRNALLGGRSKSRRSQVRSLARALT